MSCGVISGIVAVCGVALSLFLILAPSGGGFFPDLGLVVGILVFATANLISCLFNAVALWAGAPRRWLAVTILMQVAAMLLVWGWLGFSA
jgi:hypothetical protein